MFGISITLRKSCCDIMNVVLCDVSMNMKQPMEGVSNCIIRGVILYLTYQNLNGSEICRKIIETFGENVITKQKVSQQMFQLLSDRFHYRLNKV